MYINRIFLLLPLFTAFSTNAQVQFEYVFRNPQDSSYNCYLKVIPDTDSIKGLIVRDFSSLPNTTRKSPFRLMQLATDEGMMTIYTVTSNYFPELYYDDKGPTLLDDIINEVMEEHKIPKENLILGGISSSGTRALRYAQYCLSGKSKYGNQPKGIFLVDSPLDLERFCNSAANHIDNFSDGMLEEALMMNKVFPEKFGVTASHNPKPYRDNSLFSHTLPKGGNAVLFKNTPIIIFHEPDINWWIEERGASYYDINSYDLAAFANTLAQQGNSKVELITTSEKGFDRQGNRKPHSWTIVDEPYLIQWILKTL
ncbi:hypothetical protein [Owenweeksia hongkongensis]|uniref:hypothetical protein n=1 Tax=Owenweeksia hongkongensis TaxID=253245 RepID=UPI003A92A79B